MNIFDLEKIAFEEDELDFFGSIISSIDRCMQNKESLERPCPGLITQSMHNLPRPTLSTFPPAPSRRCLVDPSSSSFTDSSIDPMSTDTSAITITDVSTSFAASSTEEEDSDTDCNQTDSEKSISDYGK